MEKLETMAIASDYAMTYDGQGSSREARLRRMIERASPL